MIIALTLITIALIALWIVGYVKGDSDLVPFAVIGLVVVGLGGWGMLAGLITPTTKPQNAIVTEILKGKHIVVVSTLCPEAKEGANIVVFKNNEVDVINNNTHFYWDVDYNYYNCEISRTLKFK